MAYAVKILADSLAPSGKRLTSFEVTFPRFILAEVNTHRMLSRNSASSRAIPVQKQLARIQGDPFVPIYWGVNEPGMQASAELNGADREQAIAIWLSARDAALHHANLLMEANVHKQTANRILEPYAWHTAILTATEWDNFWHLRNHPDAQPEFQRLASTMQTLYEVLEPVCLQEGEWHLPYVSHPERQEHDLMTLVRLSVARCARTSTLTQDGVRDLAKDLGLHDRLFTGGHVSPFEHQAEASSAPIRSGNFLGWLQYRKRLPNEWDPLGAPD